MRTRHVAALGALAVMLLTLISLGVVAVVHGRTDNASGPFRDSRTTSCSLPNLSGAIVNVSLSNAGGPMMGGPMVGGGGVRGGMMRLTTDAASVPHGVVSFVASTLGSINHELVILPLPTDQIVGTRALGADSKIDESTSIGEASNTCGAGTGEGIAPASSSWTTVTLTPGRYELVCNLPGHYASGMYAQLTVR
jgi:uncharacterized cupredoxin-like copper-binding protein